MGLFDFGYNDWIVERDVTMASYTGIHFQTADHRAIADAIAEFETQIKQRRVKFPDPHAVNLCFLERGPLLFRRWFCIDPPVEGWTEVTSTVWPWSEHELMAFLSNKLACRVAAFTYSSVVGQQGFMLFDEGTLIRNLMYEDAEAPCFNGEGPYINDGESLAFEAELIEKNRSEFAEEDFAVQAEMVEAAILNMSFPNTEDFANAIGCASFLARETYDDDSTVNRIVVRSVPRWLPF